MYTSYYLLCRLKYNEIDGATFGTGILMFGIFGSSFPTLTLIFDWKYYSWIRKREIICWKMVEAYENPQKKATNKRQKPKK